MGSPAGGRTGWPSIPAWVDPGYRMRMIAKSKRAALKLGIPVTEAALVALENTPKLHNMVVCTLCSCKASSRNWRDCTGS